MAVSGHVTRSMFDRYNIGREEDVATARKAVEQFTAHSGSDSGPRARALCSIALNML
jgi:hypothetical protein